MSGPQQVGEVQGDASELLAEMRDVEDYFKDVDPNPIHLATVQEAIEALAARQPGAQVPVVWSVLQIGNVGAAYDPKGARRAFTYADQPGNIVASNLGRAANTAAQAGAGDNIDRGLSLLKSLQENGFGVFQIGEYAAPPAQGIGLGQLREKLSKLTRRNEFISGQSFSYVQLDDVLALIDQHDAAPGVDRG